MQQDRLVQNRIHRAFRRAEEQLLKSLTARKGEVKVSVIIIVFALLPLHKITSEQLVIAQLKGVSVLGQAIKTKHKRELVL